MRSIRKWLRQEEIHQGMSMVAVNIITHGSEEGWLRPAGEGHGWFTSDIIGELSDVQSLLDKPKLFFINACRGSE